jgi:hypothetical protein
MPCFSPELSMMRPLNKSASGNIDRSLKLFLKGYDTKKPETSQPGMVRRTRPRWLRPSKLDKKRWTSE